MLVRKWKFWGNFHWILYTFIEIYIPILWENAWAPQKKVIVCFSNSTMVSFVTFGVVQRRSNVLLGIVYTMLRSLWLVSVPYTVYFSCGTSGGKHGGGDINIIVFFFIWSMSTALAMKPSQKWWLDFYGEKWLCVGQYILQRNSGWIFHNQFYYYQDLSFEFCFFSCHCWRLCMLRYVVMQFFNSVDVYWQHLCSFKQSMRIWGNSGEPETTKLVVVMILVSKCRSMLLTI